MNISPLRFFLYAIEVYATGKTTGKKLTLSSPRVGFIRDLPGVPWLLSYDEPFPSQEGDPVPLPAILAW